MRSIILKILIIFFLLPALSFAQTDSTTTSSTVSGSSLSTLMKNAQMPETKKASSKEVSLMSDREFKLGLSLLLFGVIVIIVEFLIIKKLDNVRSEGAIKFISVTLIIIGGLFLITSGFSGEEIAPIVGLLGTVAGYLLGKNDTPPSK